MGAWGSGILENDDALDLVSELEQTPAAQRLDVVRERLTALAGEEGYVEGPQVSEGVAAALVVAALDDPQWADGVEDVVRDAPQSDPELKALARAALARAQQREDNEWVELWDEAGEADAVLAALAELDAAIAAT